MKTYRERHGIKVAALAFAIASFAAQAEQTEDGRYIMTVYSDMAHGRAILDGSAGELIEDIGGEALSLEEEIHLCVAYTKAKQVEHATSTCEAALDSAEEEARKARRTSFAWSNPAYTAANGHAMALNNRGVLHALTGNHDEAREMFEAALQVGKRHKYARKNLALLDEELAATR